MCRRVQTAFHFLVMGILSAHCVVSNAAAPIGAVTQVQGNTITGWACDPDTPSTPIQVHFYANGYGRIDPSTGQPYEAWARYKGNNTAADHFAGYAIANLSSPAGGQGCGGGNHGFSFTVPQSFRTRLGPGTHSIYPYMLDSNGVGPNPRMSGSSVSVTVSGTETAVQSWYSNIANDCRIWADKAWPSGGSLTYTATPSNGIDCSQEYPGGFYVGIGPYWSMQSTNETASFGPIYDTSTTSIDFEPLVVAAGYSVPMWNYGIYPLQGGGNRVGWVTDKINALSAKTKLDMHSGAFLTAELGTSAPELGGNEVFLELWFRVQASEQSTMTSADAPRTMDWNAVVANGMTAARTRFSIGMWFGADGSDLLRGIEINLAKTSTFDLCTVSNYVELSSPQVPCEQSQRFGAGWADDVGIFDRRSVGNPLVYYNMDTLHYVFGLQQPASFDGSFYKVVVPVNALLRNAPWLNSAAFSLAGGIANISGQKLRSFYIGNEVWGKGRLWVEFERFRLFKFTAN